MAAFLDLTGKVALVTGGARGIGLAITKALVSFGAEVEVFDVEPGEEAGELYRFHAVDISDPYSVGSAVSRFVKPVSLVVNNAGITRDKSLMKMTTEEWQSVIDINLGGAFNVCKAVAPAMREQGYGRIVNITSINGIRGKFGQVNYTAAKAGLIGLTKTLARELGPKGVTVNAIAPGMVMTEMAKALPEEFLAKAKAESVLPELASPEDIANAVLFLLSDAARSITGEVIRVDSGQYI